jgi:hypothetical protein
MLAEAPNVNAAAAPRLIRSASLDVAIQGSQTAIALIASRRSKKVQA